MQVTRSPVEDGRYTVSHPASIYFLDRQGRWVLALDHSQPAEHFADEMLFGRTERIMHSVSGLSLGDTLAVGVAGSGFTRPQTVLRPVDRHGELNVIFASRC